MRQIENKKWTEKNCIQKCSNWGTFSTYWFHSIYYTCLATTIPQIFCETIRIGQEHRLCPLCCHKSYHKNLCHVTQNKVLVMPIIQLTVHSHHSMHIALLNHGHASSISSAFNRFQMLLALQVLFLCIADQVNVPTISAATQYHTRAVTAAYYTTKSII